MYSGHPLGLFPSDSNDSPMVVVTNGMVVPNYSKPRDDDERMSALGVLPVHGQDDSRLLHVCRAPRNRPRHYDHHTERSQEKEVPRQRQSDQDLGGVIVRYFNGLGGMSGAQRGEGCRDCRSRFAYYRRD